MSYQELCGSSQGMHESKRTSHLKLRALLDNCPVMRKFECVRPDFAPSTWTIARSNMNQASTCEDFHTEKHLTSAPLAQLAAFRFSESSHSVREEGRGHRCTLHAGQGHAF